MMNRYVSALFLAAAAVVGPANAVQEVKGVKFADVYQVGGQSLLLNGAGVRVKYFIDVYAAGLYLPRKDPSASSVLTQPGTKSVQIVLLREISGDDFAEATEKGFSANHSDEELARYKAKLGELTALMRTFGAVKKGSVVNIDISPTGLHIVVNGQAKGDIVATEDFGRAVLKNWLGNKPVDGDLKKSMLGA